MSMLAQCEYGVDFHTLDADAAKRDSNSAGAKLTDACQQWFRSAAITQGSMYAPPGLLHALDLTDP
jgi:hypothetical protein